MPDCQMQSLPFGERSGGAGLRASRFVGAGCAGRTTRPWPLAAPPLQSSWPCLRECRLAAPPPRWRHLQCSTVRHGSTARHMRWWTLRAWERVRTPSAYAKRLWVEVCTKVCARARARVGNPRHALGLPPSSAPLLPSWCSDADSTYSVVLAQVLVHDEQRVFHDE